ncbi:hypothetical protein [Stigmatella erecta]|uniref:Cell wall polymerase n=1 Tax=Stigmatella erecta TaxID=83460 RepID=A0A1I0L5P1_9BACT|nr:hypothetical protein [Stigmatella erecta]SEU34013.1 hypothetical protein SAMN05443639_11834 [Stigmatella erecta]
MRLHVLLFLLAPVPAILLGMAVAGPAHTRAFLPNVLALLLGGACVGLWRLGSPLRRDLRLRVMACAAFAAITATLAFPGLDGVHRWLPLGPLRLNASAAFLPWLLAGMSASQAGVRRLCTVLAVLAQGVHWLQPDAAQAAALAGGTLILMGPGAPWPGKPLRMAVVGWMGGLAVGTWARADPLAPVAHVERILFLAADRGPLWLGATGAVGALLLGAFLLTARASTPARARVVLAFGTAFALTLGATFLGNFPVPLMGAGAGPVLGWYAFAAVLALPERPAGEDTADAG